MAKPIVPDNLTPGMRAGVAAGAIVDAKATEVAGQADLAMAGDVDGIHDMRVAMKRLREAVRLFRRLMPRKQRAQVLGLAEGFNDALGRVRERDVLIADARWVADRVEDAETVVGVLLDVWGEERSRGQTDIVDTWDRMIGRDRFFQRLRRLARDTKKRKRKLNAVRLEQFAYYAVTARMERALRRLEEVRAPGKEGAEGQPDPAAVHRLRIDVKRLKYTMEPFLTVLPATTEPYRVVAALQETLGLAHDFDVLQAAVTAYFDNTGLASTEPAKAVLEAIGERRGQLYAGASQQMVALGDEDWRGRLLDGLD